jgi:putative FmdB family regulatory protein
MESGSRIYNMPLFEYECRSCGRRFEYLTRAGASQECPGCAGRELDKQLSVFAVSASSGSDALPPVAGACGRCGDPRGPGACAN